MENELFTRAEMTTREMIRLIDSSTYLDLLTKWRLARPDSPWFDGMVGIHFEKRMEEKRRELDPRELSKALKSVYN